MIKVQKIILFSLLILNIIFYFLWSNSQNKKPIILEPIKISPLIITKPPTSIKITKPTNPSDILQKLKIATSKSKEEIKQSEEELVNKILTSLRKQAKQQVKVEKKKQELVVIVKKVKEKSQKKIPKVIKKPKIAKIKDKEIKKIITTPIAKIEKKVQLVKEVTVVTKKIPPSKIENTIKKAKNIQVAIETVETVEKTEPKSTKNEKRLSREEEVALYKSQYSDQLEVIDTSESFEIQESENSLPDSYYFETQEVPKSTDTSNEPLNYVEKLGVIDISNTYEVNFTISD